jgi:hypothetical protein
MYGWHGKLLRINLTTRTTSVEDIDPQVCRDFIGGRGVAIHYLSKEVDPLVDPLAPENKLIFATGPLTATPAPTGNRYMVVTKSPLTGAVAHSNSGGEFPTWMKRTGFDLFIFEGRASEPVYLLVNEDQVELRPAGHLWGKDTHETTDLLKAEHSDEARVACIGDLMVDRFVYGDVTRVSPEAPIPVLTRTRELVMLGAAGNVARNVAALGGSVALVGLIGSDQEGHEALRLVGGETVPILFGEKLTGKIGRLEMGLLDVMTRDSDVAPSENFVVGRAKYGFWRQSYVGGIFTHGEPTGGTDNTLGGADILLATSNLMGKRKNFDVAAYGLKTSTPGIHDHDAAYGAQVRYPNDRISLSYAVQEIGANFDPKLGYVQRRGVRINNASARYAPRPKKNRYVRQAYFSFSFSDYHSTVHRSVESRNASFSPFGVLFHGGQQIYYTVSRQTEQLFTPFGIHAGIRIPTALYSFTRHTLSFSGPNNKPLTYSAGYDHGGFYTGSSDQLTGSAQLQATA